MDMSHLYHDAAFGGPIVELDVKELMRTREINACEERNLARKSQSFDRAMGLCERATNWEKWRVGKTLNMILERSPHLERSLAVEKARLEALHRAFRSRGGASRGSKVQQESRGHPASSASSLNAAAAARSREKTVLSVRRPASRKGRSALKGLGRRRRQDLDKKKRDTKEDGPSLNTDLGLDRNQSKPTVYIKRNEHAVKTLARINWKQESRRRDHRRFQEQLVHFSKPLMERTRIVLRGRPDIDVEQFLQEFEDYLYPKDKYEMENPSSSGQRSKDGTWTRHQTRHPRLSHQSIDGSDKSDDQTTASSLPALMTGATHALSSSSSAPNEKQSQSPTAHLTGSEKIAARLHHLSIASHSVAEGELQGRGREGEVNRLSSPTRGLSPLSKSRPTSGSIHLPAIVATKSDVLNLRSRPGSSSNTLPGADQSGLEIRQEDFDRAMRSKDMHNSSSTTQECHETNNITVDLNNNERLNGNKNYNASSHGNDDIINSSNNDTNRVKLNNVTAKHSTQGENKTSKNSTSQFGNDFKTSPPCEKIKSGTKEHQILSIAREEHIAPAMLSTTSKRQSRNRATNETTDVSTSSQTYHDAESRLSPSKSGGISTTPSTSVSQVILEDDEEYDQVDSTQRAAHTSIVSASHLKESKNVRKFNSDEWKNLSHLPALHNTSKTRGDPSIRNMVGESGTRASHQRELPSLANHGGGGRGRQRISSFDSNVFTIDDENQAANQNVLKDSTTSRANAPNGHSRSPDATFHHDMSRAKAYNFASNYTGHAEQPSPARRSRQSTSDSPNGYAAETESDPAEIKESGHGDTDKHGGMYTLACTVGLPRLWRQSVDEKKEKNKVQPEVSAAALARKHRRSRTSSKGTFY